MAFRWTIYDPDTDETTTFLRNPVSGALPSWDRPFSSVATAAPDGKVVAFEGEPTPQTIPVNGTLSTQAQHEFWTDLITLNHQVQLTDDLGNQWWVMLTKFSPKRKNRHSHPWAADFDAEFQIVDWPG